MGRVVFLLAAILGWAVLSRRPAGAGARAADAFPFPTRESHARVDLGDPSSVESWCRSFGCSEEQLKAAVAAVGTFAEAVGDHLERRAAG